MHEHRGEGACLPWETPAMEARRSQDTRSSPVRTRPHVQCATDVPSSTCASKHVVRTSGGWAPTGRAWRPRRLPVLTALRWPAAINHSRATRRKCQASEAFATQPEKPCTGQGHSQWDSLADGGVTRDSFFFKHKSKKDQVLVSRVLSPGQNRQVVMGVLPSQWGAMWLLRGGR